MRYLVKSNYEDIINKLLKKRKYFKDNDIINFIYVDGKYAWKRNLNNLPKYNIINVLNVDKEVISLKNNLYTNMRVNFPKIYNKYFPEQINIDLRKLDINNIIKFQKKHKYVIIKPIFGYKGSGISYFNNYNDLIKYLKNIKNENKCYDIKKWNKKCLYVLSKLVLNIKLFNKKKFHLRIYYLVTFINNKYNSYLYKFAPIITAKNKYNVNKLDKDNIDSHGETTKKLNLFNINNIIKQLKELFKYIHIMLEEKGVKSYNNSNGYEIFGVDVLLTDKNRVQLLEINDKIGYTMMNIKKKKYNKFINDTFILTIDKYFNNNNTNNTDYIKIK